jgi:co-chaperonin GroES (HSP10)
MPMTLFNRDLKTSTGQSAREYHATRGPGNQGAEAVAKNADTTRQMPLGIGTINEVSSIGDRDLDDLKPGEPFPFHPIGHFVAIRVHKVTETKGGIILPDSTSDDAYQSPTATVLAIGPKVEQVKVGDLVTAPGSQPCAKMSRRGLRFTLINEEHLLGVWDS